MKGENNMKFNYQVWYVNDECEVRKVYDGDSRLGAYGPFYFLKHHMKPGEYLRMDFRSETAILKGKKHITLSYYQPDPRFFDYIDREVKVL